MELLSQEKITDFNSAIVEIAEKLFPSCADGPRRIGTDVFSDYLPRATWSFEAIGAFGRNLWPFSFRESGRRLDFRRSLVSGLRGLLSRTAAGNRA